MATHLKIGYNKTKTVRLSGHEQYYFRWLSLRDNVRGLKRAAHKRVYAARITLKNSNSTYIYLKIGIFIVFDDKNPFFSQSALCKTFFLVIQSSIECEFETTGQCRTGTTAIILSGFNFLFISF